MPLSDPAFQVWQPQFLLKSSCCFFQNPVLLRWRCYQYLLKPALTWCLLSILLFNYGDRYPCWKESSCFIKVKSSFIGDVIDDVSSRHRSPKSVTLTFTQWHHANRSGCNIECISHKILLENRNEAHSFRYSFN